jgi:hypothetical protein
MAERSMVIQLSDSYGNAEILDRQTRSLLNDFRQIDGVNASIAQNAAVSGSRGDPISVGTIVLAFVSGGGVAAVIQALGEWRKRGENRKVVLKVSVDGNTFETEFPSSGVTQKELLELTEKIKLLLSGSKKNKG